MPSLRAATIGTLALVVLSTACASRRSAERPVRVDRNVLLQQELIEHRFATAWEAVEALRSNWLRARTTDSFNTPSAVWVYMDDNRVGGVESLRMIATTSIVYIKWFDGIAATARWGIDHSQGVILVSTRL